MQPSPSTPPPPPTRDCFPRYDSASPVFSLGALLSGASAGTAAASGAGEVAAATAAGSSWSAAAKEPAPSPPPSTPEACWGVVEGAGEGDTSSPAAIVALDGTNGDDFPALISAMSARNRLTLRSISAIAAACAAFSFSAVSRMASDTANRFEASCGCGCGCAGSTRQTPDGMGVPRDMSIRGAQPRLTYISFASCESFLLIFLQLTSHTEFFSHSASQRVHCEHTHKRLTMEHVSAKVQPSKQQFQVAPSIPLTRHRIGNAQF